MKKIEIFSLLLNALSMQESKKFCIFSASFKKAAEKIQKN
jgi:hypothetical protein